MTAITPDAVEIAGTSDGGTILAPVSPRLPQPFARRSARSAGRARAGSHASRPSRDLIGDQAAFLHQSKAAARWLRSRSRPADTPQKISPAQPRRPDAFLHYRPATWRSRARSRDADLGRVVLSDFRRGFLGFVHPLLIGFRNRILVMFEWAWPYLTCSAEPG